MAFNFMDMYKSGTDAKEAGFKEIYLDPREVEAAKENFYNINPKEVEQLADSFLMLGQHSPTILGHVNGRYIIASGHKRNLANIKNIEKGHKEYTSVKFLYKEMSETEFKLHLLFGNALNRKLTPWEEAKQTAELKKTLEKAKEEGIKLEGSIKEIIAEILDTNPTKVTELNKIGTELTGTAEEKFKNGELGHTAAYELSKLEPGQQEEVIKEAEEKGATRGKEIIEIMERKKAESRINTECGKSESDQEENVKGQMGIEDFPEVLPENIKVNKHVEIPQNATPVLPEEEKKKEHYIKVSVMDFSDMAAGVKTYLLLKNDRDYKVKEVVQLVEFKEGEPTNREIKAEVIHITQEYTGLKEDYCILGIRVEEIYTAV